MCAYVYVCLSLYVYVCLYVCVYLCVCVCVCLSVALCVCMLVCMCLSVCVCVCVSMCIYVCVRDICRTARGQSSVIYMRMAINGQYFVRSLPPRRSQSLSLCQPMKTPLSVNTNIMTHNMETAEKTDAALACMHAVTHARPVARYDLAQTQTHAGSYLFRLPHTHTHTQSHIFDVIYDGTSDRHNV